MKIQKLEAPAKKFQTITAGDAVTPRKKLGMNKKPRGIKAPGARSGLKKGAGG